MKILSYIVCAAATLLSLSACAQKKSDTDMSVEHPKTLVAYFSATGTTARVAGDLAAAAGADLYEIAPEVAYTAADLDWTDSASRSSLEMKDFASRPAIKGRCGQMADYDVVYIGFPIWWYTCPTIINTFVEAHNLNGKKLVPFATSGGSTIEKACEDLKKAYPGYDWAEGRLLNNPSSADLIEWVGEVKKL